MHKAYGGTKQIAWLEVLAGEKAFNKTGQWLPAETLVRRGKGKKRAEKVQLMGTRCLRGAQDTFRKQLVGIKGPLTTPVGGGIRSLNVALRQVRARRRLSAARRC